MLFLAYLCFHHIQPAFAAPVYNVSASNTEIAPSWVAGPSGRGTWSLLYSCTFTIGLCVWTSIHLNVRPRSQQSAWFAFRCKLKWVFVALLAPEAVVYTAFSQWFIAKTFLKELKRIAEVVPSKDSNDAGEVLPKDLFDMTYAYYATMGGFTVDISHLHNTVSEGTVTTNGLLLLAQRGHFFKVSRGTIADKSKANLLAKSLVCLQVLWVAGQAIERKVAGFPVSLLEYHALVHVVCALIMYALWIQKPYDINEPTILPTESFPDLLAFIVSSSRWLGNSGFRLVLDKTWTRTDFLIDSLLSFSFGGGSEDPIFAYYGNLKDTPQIVVQDISKGETPIDVNESRLVNHLLRINRREPEPPGTLAIELPQIGTGLPKDCQYFAGNSIGRIFSPPEGVEEVLTLESGQALQSGLGPQLKWPSPGRLKGCRVGLSQKDVNRLSMAGNFVRELMTQGNSGLQASFNHPSFTIDSDDVRLKPFVPFTEGLLRPYGDILICWKQSNWMNLFELIDIFDAFGKSGEFYGRMVLAIAIILIPAAYGGIHLGAIHSVFPSAIELILWKASCFTLLGFAALLLLALFGAYGMVEFLDLYEESDTSWVPVWIEVLFRYGIFYGGVLFGFAASLLYIAARGFIVVESFISLRHVPIGVYQTPDANFLSYIPHL